MLRGNYKLGSVITFRYTSPTATDRMPTVFILASRHNDGMLHGVNLRYLTPIEQQQLQYYFKSPQERAQQTVNPFQQQHDHQTMTLRQQLNQGRFARLPEDQQKQVQTQQQQQAQQNQKNIVNGVVVKPDPKNIFGVSTFTRTTKALVDVARNAFGKVMRYVPFGGNVRPPAQPAQQPPPAFLSGLPVPNIDNANMFYYGYVKPLLKNKTRMCYRTYKHQFINNEIIIKSRR